MTPATMAPDAAFRAEYAAHRASEGRGYAGEALLALPYLTRGAHARQWAVRARSFDAFMRRVIRPAVRAGERPRVLDLGAGNGWLAYRVSGAGADATAVDLRDDAVDGLAAGAPLAARAPFHRVAATFGALPLRDGSYDVALFNASLHYAMDLPAVLREAARVVRPGGRLVVLDSPFYAASRDGERMVAEKRREGETRFGERAATLLAMPCVEYLTGARLADASVGLGLTWHRRRVRYPLWYELRGALAFLRGRRAPSRFDLWESIVP